MKVHGVRAAIIIVVLVCVLVFATPGETKVEMPVQRGQPCDSYHSWSLQSTLSSIIRGGMLLTSCKLLRNCHLYIRSSPGTEDHPVDIHRYRAQQFGAALRDYGSSCVTLYVGRVIFPNYDRKVTRLACLFRF